MLIGIDARLYGPKATGIGRYVKNLVLNLLTLDRKNTYVLFGGDDLKEDTARFPNARYVRLTTRVYSLSEQLLNPLVFARHRLDLLHVPHFNAPLLYTRPLVVTIHDLIKHLSVGPSTSTLPGYQYRFKHQIYRLLVSRHLKTSRAVIVPTFYWKDYLFKNLQVDSRKISVTHEAVDDKTLTVDPSAAPAVLSSFNLIKPYAVYVGNLYPHKNVAAAIDAVAEFNRIHEVRLELVIIGARNSFADRLPKSDFIRYLGFVSDSDLAAILSHSLCLIQPSFIEGFGLTGLEAMAAGTPVVSSSASCLPEVYQDAALYFDPYDSTDLAAKLDLLIKDPALRRELIKEGSHQVSLYSWRKMAKETLAVYEKALRPQA